MYEALKYGIDIVFFICAGFAIYKVVKKKRG